MLSFEAKERVLNEVVRLIQVGEIQPVEEFAEFESDELDIVDRYTEQALKSTDSILNGWIDRFKQLLEGSTDLEEVRDRVFDLYPQLPGGDFAEIMGSAIAAAELAGRYEVIQEGEPELEEAVDFAKKGVKSTTVKQCKTGYSCGYSCVSKTKNCKSPLSNQGKNYADWLSNQITAGIALLPHHQTDAQTMGLLGTPQPPASVPPASSTPPKAKRTKKTTPAAPPQTQTAQSPIQLNQTELDAKRTDLEKRFGKKLVEDAENNVKRILDDADVFVRVGSSGTLEAILGDRFKTSAELSVTDHQIPHLKDKNYQDARNRVEAKTLGYNKNTDPADRPIYGYLGSKDLNGQSHADVSNAYGSIAIKLKSEVKDRTTFTGSDSFKSGIASKVDDPNAASLVSSTRHGYDKDNLPNHYPSHYGDTSADGGQLRAATKARSIDDLAPAMATTGNAYVEAQIHGKVSSKDIAEIHFAPKGVNDRPNAAIAQFAKDNNVDLFVNGKKVNPDDIINANAKATKATKLSDAIDKGDFAEVIRLADEIRTDANNLKLMPGESDRYLKQLFQDSGYDGLPQVVSASDVTQAWRNGGLLMVRGMGAGRQSRTQHFDQFKIGDYFTGNGIYGNGTYVSAANGATTKAAQGALSAIRKHNYSTSSGVTMRMALPKDALVIDAKSFEKEHKQIRKQFETWVAQERTQLQAGSASAKDLKKESDAYRKSLDLTNTQKLSAGSVRMRPGYPAADVYDVTVPQKNGQSGQPLKFKLIDSVFTHERWIQAPDGTNYKVKNGASEQAALKYAAQLFADEYAAKKLGLANPTTAKVLQDFDDRVAQTKEVLFGGTGGSYSERLAVVRGYDAIRLSQSYEPDNFTLLLNRSKVMVQDTELNYRNGNKEVAG